MAELEQISQSIRDLGIGLSQFRVKFFKSIEFLSWLMDGTVQGSGEAIGRETCVW